MKKISAPGRRIIDALTKEQVESLLDAVGRRTLLRKIDRGTKDLDPDIADTVRSVLRSPVKLRSRKRPSVGAASGARRLKEWSALWDRWDAIVDQLGDEDGKYAAQDHHWDAPYFDALALAADLEAVASEMFGRIEGVFGLVNEPDLFVDAVAEADEAIRSFPEWMGADSGDGCELEGKTTLCALRWLWLCVKDLDAPGAAIIEGMEKLDDDELLVRLDDTTTVEFVTRLPAPVCREIHAVLRNGKLSEKQETPHSFWHAIVHEFERRFDKERYLERCARDLPRDWSQGAPLIEKAIEHGDWHGAEQWLVKTFAAYRLCDERRWVPESGPLLEAAMSWNDGSDAALLAKLLDIWAIVSENLHNRRRAAASRFHAAVVCDRERIGKVIDAYRTLKDGKSAGPLDALFRQWQDETAELSVNDSLGRRRTEECWIHWAIDAQANHPRDRTRFRQTLRDWLDLLANDRSQFVKHWRSLACLTADLSEAAGHPKKYPGLYSTALEEFHGESELDKSRRSLVRVVCAPGTIDMAIEIWKKRFASVIPDPAASPHGDYSDTVGWAKALRELNIAAYDLLIKRWSVVHHRRRNLWSAMRAAGLPVGPE